MRSDERETEGEVPAAYNLRPIGVLRSPFKEKFGIPRQPGLVPAARSRLELLPPYDREECLRGLEGFSHVWLIFVFSEHLEMPWRPTVRPPRLGGNRRIGVLASRSGFRPNPIGLSVAKLNGFERREGRLGLDLSGTDLLDGTPILDVKPYLPYADCPPEARGGYADEAPRPRLEVAFTTTAAKAVEERESSLPQLRALIEQLLATDPRPAYYDKTRADQTFGIRLYDFDLKWRVEDGRAVVLGLECPASRG